MSGVYSIEDLLKLRASPLICKPASLPPNEEWMGSQEPTSKRPVTRGRQEDGPTQVEGFQKRPTLDPSLRKSTTDPERIVLGPPRRSFASSTARTLGRNGLDVDDVPRERSGQHERNKTSEDLEHRIGDRKSGQYLGTNGRFSSRQDQDGTYNDRPRRKHEDEDGEGRARRDHERPKRSTRDGKDDRGLEDNIDESSGLRSAFKRDTEGRSRFAQSWRGGEDGKKDHDKGPGWRRDRVRDGDWDIPGKAEVDPEWMDSTDAVEPAQAHTQEEFQQWKERMKAKNGPTEEKTEAVGLGDGPAESDTLPSKQAASFKTLPADISSDSMDKFFARFSEKKATIEDKNTAAKPPTKTRFANLFGPVQESKAEPPRAAQPVPTEAPSLVSLFQPTPAPAPAATPSLVSLFQPASAPAVAPERAPSTLVPQPAQSPSNTDADQAGFARILEMLGKRDSTNSTSTVEALKAKAMINNDIPSHQRNKSPDLVALFKQNQSDRHTPVSQGQPPPGLEQPQETRSPVQAQPRHSNTPNKDELLLNLLRQAEISSKPSQQSQLQYNERRAPRIFGLPDLPDRENGRSGQHHELSRQGMPQRSIFDDSAPSGMAYHEDIVERQGPQRRPTNGFEDSYLESLRQNGQQQKSMAPQLPPGMPRPPGLDQMTRMPPSWSNPQPPPTQQQPQQPQQRQTLPPGIGAPRGMQVPYGGPQQPPGMPQMPPRMPNQTSRPAQRKYTGESAMPSFPPGMGPPPGFMSNGPPPGFHHASMASGAQNYGRFAMGGGEQQQQQQQPQPPQNVRREFADMYMDMYSGGERAGMRSGAGGGGVPLPPGFR